MRIRELNLLAYGKFTDQKLVFPKGAHDFHVVIGPNEAGKSTVRRAISELLFGMERQHPLGFIHDQSDLKLSAVVEGASGLLQFMRTKGQKPLKTLSGEPLSESYLAPAIGALTKDTLENLHSLDHSAMVRGGEGIVDPKNSVSQILFQATSGLKTFGTVRDELAERCSALFAARGKKNEFAAAAERLAEAQRVLKDVQVQSKAWVQASDALEQAKAALEEEHKSRAALEQQRSVWERSRRVGAHIDLLDRRSRELAETGETLPFPAGAKKVLVSGISELHAAAAVVETRTKYRDERRLELEGIELDEAALLSRDDVAHLVELSGACSKYPTDIVSRKNEVELWLREALARSQQFAWGQAEEEVRQLTPPAKVLRTLETLLQERGGVLEAQRAAQEAEESRKNELDDLATRLRESPATAEHPELAHALEQALPFKTSEAKVRALRASAQDAKSKVARELQGLGYTHLDVDKLRELKLPSLERVSTLRSERLELHAQYKLAVSRQEEALQQVAQLELQVSQYQKSHKVVTQGEVSSSRHDRDTVWGAIKAGALPLDQGAPKLDVNIRLADELADGRMVSEADGAALQALRDQLEAAKQQFELHGQAAAQKKLLLEAFDARWSELATQAGLQGLELDDMPDWLARREQVLATAESHAEKEAQVEAESQAAQEVYTLLAASMVSAGYQVPDGSGLAQLCTSADAHLKTASAARVARKALEEQHRAAQVALQQAQRASAAKTVAFDDWQKRWNAALATANLQKKEPAEVEAAIQAGREIQQLLAKVDAHRVERIGAMQAELDHFEEAARALKQTLAPELEESSAQEIVRMLAARVQRASAQSERGKAASQALDSAERELREAEGRHAEVMGTLMPILQVAGVEDPVLALPLVEAAEHKRELEEQVKAAKAAVEADSDGLSVEALREELLTHPAAEAPGKIQGIADSLAESQRKVAELIQKQVSAQQALDAINGGSSAAIAEAQRQEALADMSDASEEYLQLQTASVLLKWAVDRYRDKKQGPLIDRASEIFKMLTLGSFSKLRIDFEATPPALLAYRASNKAVGVSGLSEGTRDQLFLALRIAALELQSGNSVPVPFIADDLFINFDDARSRAGLQALWHLSTMTQVIFLSHQEHLLPVVQEMFEGANVLVLDGMPVGSA